ncbi:hypothetical protein BJY52DRAFT_1396504 [Lactarius psammicola]|nr:hypothetical protein BJY52DRAFT_1396504 [Lactarius psammicola]
MAQQEQPGDYNAFGYDPRGRVANSAGLLFGEDWHPNQQTIPHPHGPGVAPPRFGPPAGYQQPHLPNGFVMGEARTPQSPQGVDPSPERCALALGFECMAPCALAINTPFTDFPSIMYPPLVAAERASPDSKHGPPIPCVFGAATAELFKKYGGGVEHLTKIVSLPSLAEPLPSTDSPSVYPLSLPGDPSSGAIPYNAQGRHKTNIRAQQGAQGEDRRHNTTIGMLPDDVLLEIFDFYRKSPNRYKTLFHPAWKWHFLVHVCQRWRQVVFASPHRLNLQILCTYGIPVRKNIGIWPAFPIVVDYRYPYSGRGNTPNNEDNVVAALEHPDRVSCVGLLITSSLFGKIATVMQEPFPALTRLSIFSEDGNAPVLPGELLGGSAPCLQEITLNRIPYPTLPTLLLSASDLVILRLYRIPPPGYIPPEAMVASLATLPRLEDFIIEFQSATSRPDRIPPPPVTRTILPALTYFEFRGASEYLEDLISRIDSPELGPNRLLESVY